MYVHSTEVDNTTPYIALDQITDNPFHLREDHSKDSSVLTLASGILSDEQFYIICLFIIYTSQLINNCAIIANSLSIAVFVKLGFSEPSNISLTALAICDFTLAVLLTWSNVCFWLTYHNIRLPFHGANVAFLTGGAQWAFLSSTVAWITAFISFERCLCILFPLKSGSSWTLDLDKKRESTLIFSHTDTERRKSRTENRNMKSPFETEQKVHFRLRMTKKKMLVIEVGAGKQTTLVANA
ncbi:chemosensory receptor b [Plakobranchus ocellatus]|uniref:Chemosensory receptor b n=1 Tax=Plakobranchus ocellatus TaxID=259542 RepID=A0AAV4ASW2_9GAST|nr:chemosensory receptor b [Plakobranchus ocellatus]